MCPAVVMIINLPPSLLALTRGKQKRDILLEIAAGIIIIILVVVVTTIIVIITIIVTIIVIITITMGVTE